MIARLLKPKIVENNKRTKTPVCVCGSALCGALNAVTRYMVSSISIMPQVLGSEVRELIQPRRYHVWVDCNGMCLCTGTLDSVRFEINRRSIARRYFGHLPITCLTSGDETAVRRSEPFDLSPPTVPWVENPDCSVWWGNREGSQSV